MVNAFSINGRAVGPGSPCYIIAEAGVNHNGDFQIAKRLVEIAATAGADAVKFQTFSADRLATRAAPKAEYQKSSGAVNESQYEMLKRLELSDAAHRELRALCDQHGIAFMSSPFDEESATFLQSLNVGALKIPSGELTNLPYLRHCANLGVPVVVSTGMANLLEVAEAVEALRATSAVPLALLHCVSNYPAPPESSNLRAMDTLRSAFQVPTGFSDHTEGKDVALAAIALGANIIEKHFTLDRSLPGPDHSASLAPAELRDYIASIRRIELALGDGRKLPALSEDSTAKVARKSIVAKTSLPAQTKLSAEMLTMRRPGHGLPSKYLPVVLGRTLRVPVSEGTVLSWDDLL